MGYKGNKSGLYVEEDKFSKDLKPMTKIILGVAVIVFALLMARAVYSDALPHVEQQNWGRWLVPKACDERDCEKENAYAMIVIDRTKANEIGGMDSLLPGLKLTDDMFLVALVDPWTDEVRILVFKREDGKFWRTIYDFELPTKGK